MEGTRREMVGRVQRDRGVLYDVEDADEEELKAIDATGDFEGCGLDAVEMSTLSEVMKWIKESALVAKGGGGEVGSKRRASRDGERAD